MQQELQSVYEKIGRQIAAQMQLGASSSTASFGRPIGGKKKSCNKGYSCGYGCINTDLNCQNGLSGQAKTFADYLANVGVDKLTKAQKKDAEDQGLIKPAKISRKAKLPAGVESRSENGATYYTFEIDKIPVEISFANKDGSQAVLFNVNKPKDYDPDEDVLGFEAGFDVGSLQGRNADMTAIKLMRIMKYHASQQPDGTQFDTSAWTNDGMGATRTTGYMHQGFSVPFDGKSGSKQFAKVENGVLVPDYDRVNAERQKQGLPDISPDTPDGSTELSKITQQLDAERVNSKTQRQNSSGDSDSAPDTNSPNDNNDDGIGADLDLDDDFTPSVDADEDDLADFLNDIGYWDDEDE